MSTLTQCCLPPGDVQLLAVVFERNAILRWGEKTAVGEGTWAGPQEAPFLEAWPSSTSTNRPGAQPHCPQTRADSGSSRRWGGSE